ncbi:Tetratricopeptide repeat-containing protein [Tistlia consotensis]|uniref:Tetratricopeptide repeat-containing protein n=1 Tax=Tistlia consotensis USBA 355 TaxID=560819 RepID=A0A1Y6B3Y0_9PROT|nr:tetratricopeptide repeat protein [Tistlia consotensis]SME88151.1 Tetratricopeptide repeat-containing protein [Tistlia consotensis USBA 355]SNR24544.1 Tetratricopeptide repeat-containing protein [Tistlia consotensis]
MSLIDRDDLSAGELNALAVAHRRAGRLQEALVAIDQALSQSPQDDAALNTLGNCLKDAGEIASAAEAYKAAIARNPENHQALCNLALLLGEFGCNAEAELLYGEALKIAPEEAEARFGLAVTLLLQGRLAEAWPLYEARWQRAGLTPRRYDSPRWQGEPLEGRKLLLHGEQGYGDAIMTLRWLPLLQARGIRPLLHLPAPLLRLAALSFPEVEALDDRQPAPPHDAHAPLLSLPGLFGTDEASIPARVPYLAADPAEAGDWRARLAGLDRPVGLVWAGSPRHPNDANRTLALETLEPLIAAAPGRWVSLQVGCDAAQQAWLARHGIPDLGLELPDFAATAALMTALERVVAVDTASAHLAGALGRPLDLLLPFAPDWRWQCGRADSPWYPTARLHRQPTPGDWQAVVAEVADALSE